MEEGRVNMPGDTRCALCDGHMAESLYDGPCKGHAADPDAAASERFLLAGLFFLGLWPLAQKLSARPVLVMLETLPDTMDGGDLLAAASSLVLLNASRAVALYLGWFLVGSGLGATRRSLRFLSWLIPVTAIPATYLLTAVMGEGAARLHFGFPAVLSVVSVLVLRYLTRDIEGWGYKSIALALLVLSFQWLDVIPALTSWGAGWGELSAAVKTAALLMDREYLLNRAFGAVFVGLFLAGFITTELLVSYGARLQDLALLRDRDVKMAQLREEGLRSRCLAEMQQLVHDLKRPLTTMIGLADIIASGKNPESSRRYGAVIVDAGRTMEEMISEILHEDFRRSIPVEDLVQYVFSQVSPFPWRETVVLAADGEILRERVAVNVVRMSRAIVNLLDNAHRANLIAGGVHIELRAEGTSDWVELSVSDEGPGFEATRPKGSGASAAGDWRQGSGWGSTGLGLKYVTMVVENHRGAFRIEDLETGARVTVALKRADGSPSM